MHGHRTQARPPRCLTLRSQQHKNGAILQLYLAELIDYKDNLVWQTYLAETNTSGYKQHKHHNTEHRMNSGM